MKSNNVNLKQTGSYPRIKFTLSPALLSGLLAAALPLMAGAQARDARAGYSPPAPVVSRPAAPSGPSVSSPAFGSGHYYGGGGTFYGSGSSYNGGGSYGSGMRTAPTYTPSSEQGGILNSGANYSPNSRTGIGSPLYFQNGQNGQNNGTTRTQMPGGTVRTQGPGGGATGTQTSGGGTTVTQYPGGVINSGTRVGQTTFQMPAARITRTTPNAINGIIANPASSYNRFNNTAEARRYRFGVPNHGRYYYGNYGGFGYFPGDLAYYPYYSPYFSFGYTALSPYAFYYGAFPPFITLGSVYASPPQYVYVPYPVYQQDGAYNGYRGDDVDGYYLNRNNADDSYRVGENARRTDKDPVKEAPKDAALDAAVADIRDAWKTGKMDPLAKHVRKDARIAVYLRGKYQYSMDAGDYLDMTRDALTATKTTRFELDKVQRKQNGIYTVTGRHTYRDKDDNEHTVFVSYVLEKSDDGYVITQVGSAPEKVEEQQGS